VVAQRPFPLGADQSDFLAGIQLKRSIHEERLLDIRLLMFEKEIILKEQLAARCLFQCSPARKLPAKGICGKRWYSSILSKVTGRLCWRLP
jgi:hypothetical protein